MVRFSPLVAWFLTLFAVVSVTLINLSGYLSTPLGNPTSDAVNGNFLGGEQILFIEISNAENYSTTSLAGSLSWKCAVYLNAVCNNDLSKSPSETGYWTCVVRAGQTFDLYPLLLSAQQVLYAPDVQAGSALSPSLINGVKRDPITDADVTPTSATVSSSATVPEARFPTDSVTTSMGTNFAAPTAVSTTLASDVTISPIGLAAPFAFYIIGLSGSLILLCTVPGTWCGMKRRNFLNFNIAWVSFLAFLLAASLITGMTQSALSHLQSLPASRYVMASYMGPTFIGLEWSTAGAMFIASILLAAEWNMERFTPLMSTVDRRWKPSDMSWFGRKKPDPSVAGEEAEPESLKEEGSFGYEVRVNSVSLGASDSERMGECRGLGWI